MGAFPVNVFAYFPVVLSQTAFDPFGVVLRGAGKVNNYQNRFEFQGKESEKTFGLNRINLGARTYNPTIGRMDRVDMMSEKFHSFSPYNSNFNSPLRFIDPDGNEAQEVKDFTYTDGYGTYSSRNSSGSVGFSGTYENTFGDDKPKPKNTITTPIPTSTKNGVQSTSMGDNIAQSTLAFIAIDIAVPEPTDVVLPKWAGYALAGTAATAYLYSSKIAEKMSKEIDRILTKTAGPQGYTYELRVNQAGTYMNVRGQPITLKSGDIWKFGQTADSPRYSPLELNTMVPGGVKMNPFYFGNQVEIKVMEKYSIYGYYFNKGTLPPGNKIFR